MAVHKSLVILLSLSWATAQPLLVGCAHFPVRVTVFYEAMHEDSRTFIVDQLKPTFDSLGPGFMLVELVPYGKARDVSSDPAKGPITYTFYSSQHQPQYEANKLQACALLFLAAYPLHAVDVVACALAYPEGALNAYGACFADVGLVTKSKIHACAVGSYGDHLLSHHGRATHARQPPIRLYPDTGKIPRVEFDGEYDAYDELLATIDLRRVVCRRFRGATKRRCKRRPIPPRKIYPKSSTTAPLPGDSF